MLVPALLLALCLGSLAWFIRNDRADYRAFKLLTSTADRQRRYRAWALRSFLLFSCAAVAALAILHRLRALVLLPAEFRPLFQSLQPHTADARSFVSGLVFGLLGALTGSLLIALLLPLILRRRVKPVMLGDVAPLMPRNAAETWWTALLSVNAGVGEELYFRLLLPLLLVSLTGNALLAFILAALLFGAAHFYQGVVGILATTAAGAVLTALYLWTGNLWMAVAAHALLDLLGLVVRPTLTRLAEARMAQRA